MRRGQIITLAVAGVASVAAMFAALNLAKPQAPTVQVQERTVNTVQVLVAKNQIGLGDIITRENLRWQHWPQDALTASFIQDRSRPNAMSQLVGHIARSPIMPNEPITDSKVVKPEGGGVLAAILQPGMRAISTRIKEETGVGRLILPNDHVDVILTQRKRGRAQEEFIVDVLFRNVRVLAIGQQLEVKLDRPQQSNNPNSTGNNNNNAPNRPSVDGNTATLELTPKQAELLALANSMGEISLALRSVADIKSAGEGGTLLQRQQQTGLRMIKYGQRTRAAGVQ
jgi:pilus assembly protein CpaB